ncbi:MAG: polyphosphate kinase 2 [Enhydrobacter sp.]|nr:MAG: polyphosphate kinase 2 [Enhydrobacter sp.]
MTAIDSTPHSLGRKAYAIELRHLQLEYCRLQEWVRLSGERIVVVLEGRTAAGRGTIVRKIADCVNPRIFRMMTLPSRSPREASQTFMQRFFRHLPAAGELILFNPSWYRLPNTEYVIRRSSSDEHRQFLQTCPVAERFLIETGIRLIKVWLEVGPEQQQERLAACLQDPLLNLQVEDVDLELSRRWYEFSKARDLMFDYTDTDLAPWHIVHMDDRRRGVLNALAHILSQVPYKTVDAAPRRLPERDDEGAYDDYASLAERRLVEIRY